LTPAKQTFDESIYNAQKADYDHACAIEYYPVKGRKLQVRIAVPDRKTKSGVSIKTKNKRYIFKSTFCDSISQAERLNPQSKISYRDEAVFAAYCYFDELLGIVREPYDPFAELIDKALRQIRNPNIATPKLDPFMMFFDFLVDDEVETKDDLGFLSYTVQRQTDPSYRPTISTKIIRSGLVLEKQGDEYDTVASDYAYWDYILDNLDTTYENIAGQGLGIGVPAPHLLAYVADIYESMRSKEPKNFIKKYGRKSAIVLYFFAFDGRSHEMFDLYSTLDPQVSNGTNRPEAALLKHLFDPYEYIDRSISPVDPRPREFWPKEAFEQEPRDHAAVQVSTAPTYIPNLTGAPTILDCLPRWMGRQRSKAKRQKTVNSYPAHIHKCVEIIGNLPVDRVQYGHAEAIALWFEDNPKSNGKRYARRTIETYFGTMKMFFAYIQIAEMNEKYTPPKPWFTHNHFANFDLSNRGEETRSWEALSEDQLHKLFAMDMPDDHRLIFNMLIKCGFRLDEVCLLTWEQLKYGKKEGERHIRYFDLSTSIVKNDRFSKRNAVLPDSLILPSPKTGMIFPDFERFKNADGKVSNEVSKILNEKYLWKIRYNELDNRKVVHSLRHNLIGLIGGLTNPSYPQRYLDWISGHGMKGDKTESEGEKTYGADPDLSIKYDILNRVKHPWSDT
jgi:integrase